MTNHQVALVKSSWKIFPFTNPVLVGDVFYSKLFATSPKLKRMFTISKEEQSKKFVEMLNILVGRLDRMEELTEEIRQLAIRHVSYGVKPEHYQSVGLALLWTLEQGLGKDWTKEVGDAWRACYQMLSKTMIEATGEVYESAKF
jgi:hemoglobin-like flavoprotein